MRKFVQVFIQTKDFTPIYKSDDIAAIVKKYKKLSVIPCKNNGFNAYFYFYEDMEAYRDIRAEAEKRNLIVNESYYLKYSDEEKEQLLYFQLELENKCREEGIYTSDCGAVYQGGCNCCKYGQKLIGNFYIPTRMLAKYDISSVEPEIIISESLYEIFEKNQVTGCNYEEVFDTKTRKMSKEFRRIIIKNTVPSLHRDTLKRIRQCEVCQKEWIVFGGNMIYEENAMGAFEDINIAVEHFSRVVPYGGNYKYNFSRPYVIISQKVRKLLLENCKKVNFDLKPIVFEK